MSLLDSAENLEAGLHALRARDPDMARLVREGVMPPLRKRDPGLAGLLSIIVAQQVSTASAAAIWGRFAAAFPGMSAELLASACDEDLRRPGLSRPKIRTIRAVATAISDGTLPLDTLHMLPGDEAHRLMIAVSGIGPWTADIYLLFCLGHPDVFPAGDLALQEAARIALGLPARPNAREMAAIAERWRPWRGVAAGVLWAYYRHLKSRDGAPVLATPSPD